MDIRAIKNGLTSAVAGMAVCTGSTVLLLPCEQWSLFLDWSGSSLDVKVLILASI